jgi:gluconolactonase
MTTPKLRVLAEFIQHPEGPDLLPDGRVVFVETWTGLVKALDPASRRVDVIARTGGGPNACCVDADGDVLVTQNGGRWHLWTAEDPVPAGIQRVRLDGRVESVTSAIAGIACVAPNDLCFGADGRLYFTDPGAWFPPETRGRQQSHVFALDSTGAGEVIAELGDVYPNGIAASRDGVVWAESHTRLIKMWSGGSQVRTLAELPEGHVPDGLKFDYEGKLWITTVEAGVMDVLDLATGSITELACPYMPLNCVFVPGGVLVTDGGLFDPLADIVPRHGRLVMLETAIEGQPRFRGRVNNARDAEVPDSRGYW